MSAPRWTAAKVASLIRQNVDALYDGAEWADFKQVQLALWGYAESRSAAFINRVCAFVRPGIYL